MPGSMRPEVLPGSVLRKLAVRLDRTDQALAVGNRAGVVEWTNDAWHRVTGWPLEDMVDKPISHLLDRIGIEPSVLDFVQTHFLSGRRCAVELPIEAEDGRHLRIHLEVDAYRDDSGEVTDFVACATDVTERCREEAGREAPSAKPSPASPVALESFAVASIETAQRVERLSDEIGRMTAVGLLDELGIAAVRERADGVFDAAEALVERAHAAKAPPQPTEVAALVAQALDSARLVQPVRIALDVDLPDPSPRARVAPSLAQLVETLLDDAASAIDDAWGTISVGVGTTRPGEAFRSGVYWQSQIACLSDTSPSVFVELHDTGRALAPSDLERLERPLLPLPPPGRLARLLCAGAKVRAMGGRFLVDAAPGCGTRVLMLFPSADDA